MYVLPMALAGGFGLVMLVLIVVAIGLVLVPGLIANKRNHP